MLKLNTKIFIVSFLSIMAAFGLFHILEFTYKEPRSENRVKTEFFVEREKAYTEMDEILNILASYAADFDLKRNDPWGTPYKIIILIPPSTTEGLLIISGVEVRSAGPDKRFGNHDDLRKEQTEFNRQKAGETLGKRAKEFFKGYSAGFQKESK